MDFGVIADNKAISKFILLVLYGVLLALIGYNGIYYLIYFSANQISQFVPRQHLFLLLLSSGEFVFLSYANHKIKYQIHHTKMILKRSKEDNDDIQQSPAALDLSIKLIRKKILLKNTFIMIISGILASIIFYVEGILQNITILGLAVVLIYYYNHREINPAEIKDSMKYDRQKIDLDGGLAVSKTRIKSYNEYY